MYTNSAVSRFVGRPAKPCRKCKSTTFIVNQFGGVECHRCTKEQGDFPRLYVVAGEYSDEPDEWNVAESHGEAETELEPTSQYESLFRMGVHVEAKTRTWSDVDPELSALVEWYHENRLFLPTVGPITFHVPGRRARGLRDMQHQLSPQIYDPIKFYESLDCEIDVQGVNGPRVACGTLKADLQRLKEIAG